jgi:hypothetical protein
MLNKILRAAVKAGLLSFCLVSPAFYAVTRYPAPPPIRLSSDYTILADGLPIDVYVASTHLRDGKYSNAYFDFSSSVIVSIKSKLPPQLPCPAAFFRGDSAGHGRLAGVHAGQTSGSID